jgi:hypothetical protein
MGLIAYEVPPALPGRFPQMMGRIGARCVRQRERPLPSTVKGYFAYKIFRGHAVIEVWGAEDRGNFGLFFGGRSLNPLSWWSSNRLEEEIERELVRAGAKPFPVPVSRP